MKTTIQPVWTLALALALIASVGVAHAQTTTNPATRTHVKIVDGQAIKFSSKLQKVIELNFTFNFHHNVSKPIIANTLTRIATNYGTGGVPAFTVQRHVGPNGGTSNSSTVTPDFTLADLNSAQVIFANQISAMGHTNMTVARRTAIQTAIQTNGIGYFALHGSGDDETKGWTWYTQTLHPMNYKGHGDRTLGPVYKNPVEREHIVTHNVLVSGMTQMNVPTSVDGSGNEVLTPEPIRQIRNEWYRFGDDIRAIPALAPNLTVLSLYDPRNLGTALGPEFRRKGGNMYTYLYKVGNGMTHYLPAGHDNSEIMETGGFDGGVGDWDRYFAQVLFFLAGYNQTPCDASCEGLPIVTATNRLTGTTYTSSSINSFKAVPNEVQMGATTLDFSVVEPIDYNAQVMDVSGKVLMQATGYGTSHAFDQSNLKSGVYFMRVSLAGGKPISKRYVVTASR